MQRRFDNEEQEIKPHEIAELKTKSKWYKSFKICVGVSLKDKVLNEQLTKGRILSEIFISEKQKLIIFIMNDIKVISFNCGGLKSNVELINLLLNESDILCVQETLLFK